MESIIRRVTTDEDARRAAAFFAANLTASYISHSELQIGRALDETTWSPDVEAIFLAEIRDRVPGGLDGETMGVWILEDAGTIVGMAYLTHCSSTRRPYSVIEDMVIAASVRGTGIGSRLMEFLVAESRRAGSMSIFLESGLDNEAAHHFFHGKGFHQVSIVMRRTFS